MYKIEFQYLDNDGKWYKAKHKFYEKEATFNQYWKYHSKYVDWRKTPSRITGKSRSDHRIIGYKDGVQICEYM